MFLLWSFWWVNLCETFESFVVVFFYYYFLNSKIWTQAIFNSVSVTKYKAFWDLNDTFSKRPKPRLWSYVHNFVSAIICTTNYYQLWTWRPVADQNSIAFLNQLQAINLSSFSGASFQLLISTSLITWSQFLKIWSWKHRVLILQKKPIQNCNCYQSFAGIMTETIHSFLGIQLFQNYVSLIEVI